MRWQDGTAAGRYNAANSLGNTYDDTRSNEFGYADYKLLPTPPVFIHPFGTGEAAQQGAAD